MFFTLIGAKNQRHFCHFFRPYKVVAVEGEIIRVEKNVAFCRSSSFLALVLKEKKTGHLYRVFLAPVWFIRVDFEVNGFIKVIGSPVELEKIKGLIAREIYWKGEKILLRDRRGFPYWGRWKRRQRGRGR